MRRYAFFRLRSCRNCSKSASFISLSCQPRSRNEFLYLGMACISFVSRQTVVRPMEKSCTSRAGCTHKTPCLSVWSRIMECPIVSPPNLLTTCIHTRYCARSRILAGKSNLLATCKMNLRRAFTEDFFYFLMISCGSTPRAAASLRAVKLLEFLRPDCKE